MLKASGASAVLDLGCGEGNLLRDLLKEKQFNRIVGVDVSVRSLERAAERLVRLGARCARIDVTHATGTITPAMLARRRVAYATRRNEARAIAHTNHCPLRAVCRVYHYVVPQ